MRPEDFKLNSDYLSLATATEYTGMVTFSPATVAGGTSNNQTINVSVPSAKKVICEYTMSLDGVNWFKTNEHTVSPSQSNTMVIISLQRVSNNILQVSLTAGNIGSSAESIPSYVVYFKESTIIAPDMK